MKAVVKNIVREEHPWPDNVSGATVPVDVIAVEVDFLADSGELFASQRYAFHPDQLGDDLGIFDRQAAAMQTDIDHAVVVAQQRAEEGARHAPVDARVGDLRRHFGVSLGDAVAINDRL